jgi:pimeloyl-ACP methyl ester carboxylesterase
MADIARAVACALDAHGVQRADVFGMHSGHKVAAAIAEIMPDRVRKLVVAGKPNSLIPERDLRNKAMAEYVALQGPDVALVRFEGQYVDDPTPRKGFEAIFEANYAFDFSGALQRSLVPTLVIEIRNSAGDTTLDGQGARLADSLTNGQFIFVDEVDETGLHLYAGVSTILHHLVSFLDD